MLNIIAALVATAVSFAWFWPGIRAQKNNKVLKKEDYIQTALIYGLLFTCGLIIVTEITYDSIAKHFLNDGYQQEFVKELIGSFLRAALLEETFKFLGFYLAKKKLKLYRKIDFVMIAGLMGLMYTLVEKFATANMFGIIVGAIIPMHIMWQLNQGGHFFEYEKAKKSNNKKTARKELFMALAIPFIFHGCYDAILTVCAFMIQEPAKGQPAHPSYFEPVGGCLLGALIIISLIYSIRTVIKVKKIAVEDKKMEQTAEV